MAADNEPAENAVRANHLRLTTPALLESLAAGGARAAGDPRIPEAVVIEGPFDAHGSPGFLRGELMPQSRASMLVAHVLDPRPDERVLDLCAAPGAKTSHIAALMHGRGEVVAVEADPARASSTRANCDRLGAACVEVVVGDAAEPDYGDGYDRVLVDPPCSDLGTLQSRPDARWRKQRSSLAELAALQRRILEAAAAAVRPGGRLVYSTCTISPSENRLQMEDFLSRNRNFRTCEPPRGYAGLCDVGGFVQTLPHRDGTDGFFIAALDRED